MSLFSNPFNPNIPTGGLVNGACPGAPPSVSCVHVIDPDMVLLGGAMTFGRDTTMVGREFMQRVRQEFRTRTFPTLAEKITIDWASLGGDAGFIGAAGCARLAVQKGRLSAG